MIIYTSSWKYEGVILSYKLNKYQLKHSVFQLLGFNSRKNYLYDSIVVGPLSPRAKYRFFSRSNNNCPIISSDWETMIN